MSENKVFLEKTREVPVVKEINVIRENSVETKFEKKREDQVKGDPQEFFETFIKTSPFF